MRSNWSKLGAYIGLVWSIGFAIRYLFIWQDFSQAALFIGLGLGLIAFSWVFDQILRIKNTLSCIEDYIADRNYNFSKRVRK